MSGRRPDDEAHGLSRREWAIMDRHDEGMSTDQIAAELDLKRTYVSRIISTYSGSWSQNNAFDAMVRAGSIALASAIARTGKVFS
jgi:DNA-binding NarL/FixJ family response regulator